MKKDHEDALTSLIYQETYISFISISLLIMYELCISHSLFWCESGPVAEGKASCGLPGRSIRHAARRQQGPEEEERPQIGATVESLSSLSESDHGLALLLSGLPAVAPSRSRSSRIYDDLETERHALPTNFPKSILLHISFPVE